MTFQFEKLLVYQKSVDFADEVCKATESDPLGKRRLLGQSDVNQTLRFLNENLFDRSPNHEEAIQFADQFDWILDSLGALSISANIVDGKGRFIRSIGDSPHENMVPRTPHPARRVFMHGA